MAKLRITRLGHGGVLYRSPDDAWVWVDRWTGAPNFAEAYRSIEKADVADHVGDDAADLIALAKAGAQVVGSHELSLFLGERGIESVGMNTGGTFEAAGIKLSMVHADHSGAVTLTGGGPTHREVGCWGWVLEFEDGTRVYHSGDTDVFGDMALVRERWAPTIGVFPIGGHYTMGPVDAARAVALAGVATVIPIHYATFPILAGTPAELQAATGATVVELQPGETWEA